MRTTLDIEDQALAMVKKYAEERGVSMGRAASDLIHRGANRGRHFKKKNGWVILEPPLGAPPLTNEILDQWENEGYEEEYRRAFPSRR